MSDHEQEQDPEQDQHISDTEMQEIANAIMDICARSGYGVVIITVRSGEIFEMDVSYKLRPKVEKKKTQI